MTVSLLAAVYRGIEASRLAIKLQHFQLNTGMILLITSPARRARQSKDSTVLTRYLITILLITHE